MFTLYVTYILHSSFGRLVWIPGYVGFLGTVSDLKYSKIKNFKYRHVMVVLKSILFLKLPNGFHTN